MYGFRKVADCSDRTYSHPFFRRDQPELLTQVRRVVNDPLGLANANANSHGGVVKRSPAAIGDGKSPRGRGDGGEVFRHPSQKPQQQQGQQRRAEVTATPPDAMTQHQARQQDSRMPHDQHQVQEQRLKAGGCAISASAAASSSLNPSRQEFSRMWQKHSGRWSGLNAGDGGIGGSFDDDGRTWTTSSSSAASSSVEDNATSPVLLPITPASLDCSSSCVPPFRLQAEVDPSLADVGRRRESGGGGGYGQHRGSVDTGSTIVVHNSVGNPNGGSAPALVSPAAGSSSASTMPVLGGALEYWRGAGGVPSSASAAATAAAAAPAAAASMSTFGRLSSSALYPGTASKLLAPGQLSGGGSGAWRGNADGGTTSGFGDTRGVSAPIDESTTLSLDKAFGFGTALARYPSFDLATGRSSPQNCHPGGTPQPDNLKKNGTTNADDDGGANNAVVPVSPTASPYEMAAAAEAAAATAATAAGDGGWDLACLGGAGWGSPDTSESPAAEVWAAIPPLTVAADAEPGPPSSSSSSSSSSPRLAWGSFGAGGATVVEGGSGSGSGSGSSSVVGSPNHRQQFQLQQQRQLQQLQQRQQQQRHWLKHKEPQQHSRSYSRGSLPGSSGVADSLDWTLFAGNGGDAYGTATAAANTFSAANTFATPLGFGDEASAFMRSSDNVGGENGGGGGGGGGLKRRESSTGTAGTSGYL
ncbi:unnamed protein product [Scytosiphon promiscuus]